MRRRIVCDKCGYEEIIDTDVPTGVCVMTHSCRNCSSVGSTMRVRPPKVRVKYGTGGFSKRR